MNFSDDLHFNSVQSWLESSSHYQSGDDFSDIRSDVSSSAHTSRVEPEFPSYVYDDTERKERMSNLWNSTGAIISDIQKCSDFSKGTVKLKKKHLAPKPITEKEAEPLQNQHKERWNDFEYISNSIQGKKSPNRRLQSVNLAKAKTAQAWAVKPAASAKPVNKGRGSLLIKTPESLSNLMEQIGAPSYQNHNIEDFINSDTGKFDDTDESDSESSYDAAGSKSLSSASGKDDTKTKSIYGASVITKPASKGAYVYVPPHRRNQLAKTPESNVNSLSSSANGPRCKSLRWPEESNKAEEESQLALKGKNWNGASRSLNVNALEFVELSNVGATTKLSEGKSSPQKEQKKPFFSLLAKTTLPVGVVARRNPTVLKLVEKMSDCEITSHSKTNSDESSYRRGENFTLSQASEENAAEVLYTEARTSKSAEKISSGGKAVHQKNDVELPKPKIPLVHNPGQINPNQLFSKLSELKRLQNEMDEADNLNSPDSCINDYSENSELELELEWNEEEDTGGYSSGFSDNMADSVFTAERAPDSELSLVTIPCDDNYCNDDFYNRSLPAYCLQSEYSSDRRRAPHRVSSSRPNEAKSFTLNPEDFPKL